MTNQRMAGVALALAACGKSAPANQTGGSGSSGPAIVVAPPLPEAPVPAAKPPSAGGSAGSVTLKTTGGYVAERTLANTTADPQVVLCTKASTIFSVLHSGDAKSGNGNLAGFAVSTAKFHGAGTYAFDDGSAMLSFVDWTGEKVFSEDTNGPATKTGSLTIAADGKSGSFKIAFGPGGDPPTGAVEVGGTFACPDFE